MDSPRIGRLVLVAAVLFTWSAVLRLAAGQSGPTLLTPLHVGHSSMDANHPFFDVVRAAASAQPGEPAVEVGAFPAWTPARCLEYAPLFLASAERHDVAPALLVSVAIAETGCQPTLTSHAGALGMMQIVPRWHPSFDVSRWREPAVSIDYGASFLARLGARTGASRDKTRSAIYAYNSGGLQTAEGRRYLRYVGGMWDDRDKPSSPAFLEWCNAGSGFGLDECRGL